MQFIEFEPHNSAVTHADTAIGQSTLLDLHFCSITIVATSVILLVAMIMITLFSTVKVFLLTSCQRGSSVA